MTDERVLEREAMLEPAEGRLRRWVEGRDAIRVAIEDRGWSHDLGSFRQALDEDELDAASLMIPIVGFLPADDERVASTIRAVEEQLSDDHGLVFRYATRTASRAVRDVHVLVRACPCSGW